jgi:aconitate hydratase
LSVLGLKGLAPGSALTLQVTHLDGSVEKFPVKHSYSANQIAWFKAGSALNAIG